MSASGKKFCTTFFLAIIFKYVKCTVTGHRSLVTGPARAVVQHGTLSLSRELKKINNEGGKEENGR